MDPSPAPERVLAVLRAAPGAVAASEVARVLGVHPTTIRFHLDRLERAGRVLREAGPARGRGRPATLFRAVAGDDARVRMIAALADAVAGEGDPVARAEAAGAVWAHEVPDAGLGARDAILAEFARIGFAPQPGGRPDAIVLHACPFLEAARARPGVVCGVHRGLAEALAIRAGATGAALIPFTPEGCVLEISGGA